MCLPCTQCTYKPLTYPCCAIRAEGDLVSLNVAVHFWGWFKEVTVHGEPSCSQSCQQTFVYMIHSIHYSFCSYHLFETALNLASAVLAPVTGWKSSTSASCRGWYYHICKWTICAKGITTSTRSKRQDVRYKGQDVRCKGQDTRCKGCDQHQR